MSISEGICWLLAVIFAAVLLVALAARIPVQADEEHMRMYHADAQQNEWMRSLIRPDTKTSCCSLNDCNPTDADWRNDQWWAVIRGEWRPVPHDKVLTKPLSIDGEAWVCASKQQIYCFIPPLTSY